MQAKVGPARSFFVEAEHGLAAGPQHGSTNALQQLQHEGGTWLDYVFHFARAFCAVGGAPPARSCLEDIKKLKQSRSTVGQYSDKLSQLAQVGG